MPLLVALLAAVALGGFGCTPGDEVKPSPRSQHEVVEDAPSVRRFEIGAAGPFVVERDGVWAITRDERDVLRLVRLDPASGEVERLGRLGAPFPGDVLAVRDEMWTLSHYWDDSGGRWFGSIERWDRRSLELVGRYEFENARPTEMAWAAGDVWVTAPGGEGPDDVWRIEPTTGRVTEKIRVGAEASGIEAAGGRLWVPDGIDGGVWAIDARSGETTGLVDLPAKCGSSPALVRGDNAWAFDCNPRSGDTEILRKVHLPTGRVLLETRLGELLGDIVVARGRVWILDIEKDVVFGLDRRTGRLTHRLGVPDADRPPSLLVAARRAIWTNSRDGTLTRIGLD